MTVSANSFIHTFLSLLQPKPSESPNRAPQGAELSSPRDRASEKQNVLDQITHDANAATASYESIRIQYGERPLVSETLQSDPQLAKALMDSSKELAPSSDPEMRQLQALLQPIRRYPDDILRLIFEEYASSSLQPFSAAINLSHVCQRWRDVAISTATLWKWVTFSGVSSTEALESRAEAFVKRVGRVPAKITIYINDGYWRANTVINPAKRIPFDLIYATPVISCLEFRVYGEGTDPSGIFDSIDHFPRGNVDSLLVHFQFSKAESFCPDGFVSKFSGLRMLKLHGSFELSMSPTLNLVLTGIVQLHLEELDHLAITQLLQLTRNNLQKLTLTECELAPSSEPHTERCVMHRLCSLSVDCNGFPWNQIQCPELAHLVVPDRTVGLAGARFWQFCSTTESITSITINLDLGDLEQFTTLARGPHRLRTLRILYPTNKDIVSVLVRHDGLDRPPFPELLHLTFKRVHRELKANTLDSLVQRRCFPRGHPESRMDQGIANALERFEITTETGPTDWECSRYLAKHFEMARSPSLRSYRFVGKFGLD